MRVQNDTNEVKDRILFYNIIKIILAVGVVVSFWIFSRLTIDDAFITWRYGKNLVFHGIWNYNPSSYDMTQAYTNPIYAYLSIIPAYFRIDTVLFFKLVSLLIIFIFVIYYSRKVKQATIILLATFLLPQTMIHIFSGMETFLFIILSTILIISIQEDSLLMTMIASAFLLYTRPESWPLLVIIPLVYCNWQSIDYMDIFKIKNYRFRIMSKFTRNFITIISLKMFFVLSLLLLPNLIISYFNFNNILPNTFFVKNTSVFSFNQLKIFGLTLLPLILAYKYVRPGKMVPILLFFLFIIIQYSKTSLFMDYNLRFLYHIYFPIVLFVFYLMEKDNKNRLIIIRLIISFDDITRRSLSFKYKNMQKIVILVILGFFLSRDTISDLALMANYYYRCISSAADAGKIINDVKGKYNINSISCGDAGMLAFNADIDSLDLYRLGSAIFTHSGIDTAYSLYKPEVLFLHGSEENVRSGYFESVRDISKYENIGKITWSRTYYYWVYSKNNIPELRDVFENSYSTNYKGNKELLLKHIFLPPWSQWHE